MTQIALESLLPTMGKLLLEWYLVHRRDLPWRHHRDPYRIWVSETMLQQTQVDTVIPYYNRFLERFPTLSALAEAETGDVLRAWEGLGYYSRAKHLQTGVREVQAKHQGHVPDDVESLRKLPGVGDYTAGAIASIAFNQPEPAVDGNVSRVMSRLLAIKDDVGDAKTRRNLKEFVRVMIPDGQALHFTQALMELGAIVCLPRNPACNDCPLRDHCQAAAAGLTDELPVKAKRAKVVTETMAVLIWEQEGLYAVEQRPEQGMLSGQWQFPLLSLGSESSPMECCRQEIARRGGEPDRIREVGLFSYRYTHRQWQQHVFYVRSGTANPPPYRWVAKEELSSIHLITAHKRIMAQAQPLPA